MRKRIVTAVATGVLAAIALAASPVGADNRPPGPGGGAYVDSSGDPTAHAQDGAVAPDGGGDGSSGGDGTAPPCQWEVAIENDAQFPIYDVDTLDTMHSNTGRWMQYVCEGQGPVAVGGQFLTPEGGLVDPAALAAEALASIGIGGPDVHTSPEAPRLYVHIATWLSVDEGWWHSYEATATAGNVTVTVRAEPMSMTWNTGDGQTIECEGPGGGADCSHTYRSSHSGLTITATVDFGVTWTSNIGPAGELGPISRSSAVDVVVGEIQGTGRN